MLQLLIGQQQTKHLELWRFAAQSCGTALCDRVGSCTKLLSLTLPVVNATKYDFVLPAVVHELAGQQLAHMYMLQPLIIEY